MIVLIYNLLVSYISYLNKVRLCFDCKGNSFFVFLQDFKKHTLSSLPTYFCIVLVFDLSILADRIGASLSDAERRLLADAPLIDSLLTDSRSLADAASTLFFAISTPTGDGARFVAPRAPITSPARSSASPARAARHPSRSGSSDSASHSLPPSVHPEVSIPRSACLSPWQK